MLIFGAKDAHAELPIPAQPVHLTIDAPCTDSTDFGRRLGARTLRIVSVGDDKPADEVVVRIVAEPRAAEGTFEIVRGHGPTRSRRVEATTCDEVADMLSLAVALTYDPNALVMPSANAPPPPPAPELPAPAVTGPVDVPATATPTRSPAPAWGLRLGVQGVVAPAPDATSFGGQLFADLAHRAGPSFRLGFEGRRAEATTGPVSVDLVWALAQPLVCPVHLRASRFDVAPCAGVALGIVTVNSQGASDPHSSVRAAVAPSLTLLGSVAVSDWISLEARASVEAPLVRADFKVDSVVAYEDPVVLPSFGLGLTFATSRR